MSSPIITRLSISVLTSFLVMFSAMQSASADVEKWPADGSFIRVTRDGGASPWLSVYYDLTIRGRTVVVTLVRDTLCRTVSRERLELMDDDEAVDILDKLSGVGAFRPLIPEGAVKGRAADTKPDPSVARYEFWAADGRRMTRFHVTRPVLDSSPELIGIQSLLREFVTDLVEPFVLRDVFHPAARTGIVAITSSEPATAVIDGRDRVNLPVSSLTLKTGTHQVVVVGASGATRNFTVRIVPGENAAIHVLLDEPPVPSGVGR